MSATVKIDGTEATISAEDGLWHSDDADLAKKLNALLFPEGVSGAEPNPPLMYATLAIEKLGGELLRYDPTERDELIFKDEGDEG